MITTDNPPLLEEVQTLKKELEKYKEYFTFCSCGTPQLRSDMSNFDRCPQCQFEFDYGDASSALFKKDEDDDSDLLF
jgi:hypothetical protein